MKDLKKKVVGVIVAVTFLGAGLFAMPTNAALFNSDSNLTELLVLSQLFGGGGILRDQVVVQSGDTLSGIAQLYLGNASRYPEIVALNNIADPDLIYPGQVLSLPDGVLPGGNLGSLIVLSELFDSNGVGGDSDFLELYVLSELFSSNTMTGNLGGLDLESLIVLEALSDNGISGNSSLETLIYLEALNQGSGLFMGNLNVGDLIILDELFN